MVSVHLPVEVWLLVCEVLETEKDFGALFKCVSVNKMVAAAAVKSLYRYVNPDLLLSPLIRNPLQVRGVRFLRFEAFLRPD